MYRPTRLTAPVRPWLAAPFLIYAAATLIPATAMAQAASNLNCNKCVDSDDVAKNAITKKKIKKDAISKNRIKEGAVDQARLSTELQDHVDGRVSYYVTLDGDGAEATIATNGPLTYFARCFVNRPDGAGGLEDGIDIVATSSESGWFQDSEVDSRGSNAPLSAGDEVVVDTKRIDPSEGARYDDLDESVAMAPDGSYLAIDGEAGGVAVNAFGHDCLAVGNYYRITGTL